MGESEPREHRGLHTKESISEGWLRHTCIIQRLFFPITCKTLEEEYKAKSDSGGFPTVILKSGIF